MMKAFCLWDHMEWHFAVMRPPCLNRWRRIKMAQRATKSFFLSLILTTMIVSPIATWGCVMNQDLADNMEKMIVKLTYLGIQDKPIPSLLFSVRVVPEALEMLKRHQLLHANDEYGITNIVIVPQRLQKLVELVEQRVGNVVDDSTPSVLGVALIVAGQKGCREFQLASTDAAIFFNQLHEELSSNKEAVTQFDGWRVRTNL